MNLLHNLGAGLSGMEQIQRMLAEGRRPGMADVFDVRLVEVAEGRVVMEAPTGAHLYNPMGTVHGGFAATLLDFACGYAMVTRLSAGQAFTTLELKVAYHKAMTADTGMVRAEGTIISGGRRAAFAEARLTGPDGRLLASATSSLLVMAAA